MIGATGIMIPDSTYVWAMQQKLFKIDPYDAASQQPISYDVHLGPHALLHRFDRMHVGSIDPSKPMFKMHPEIIPYSNDMQGRQFVIGAGMFMLGETTEKITLSKYVAAELMGKSTLGRLGLFIHVTAGLVDPGWGMHDDPALEGARLTVELYNASPYPIRLWAGMPIGQLVFTYINEGVARPYGHADLKNHYQGDQHVRESAGFTE